MLLSFIFPLFFNLQKKLLLFAEIIGNLTIIIIIFYVMRGYGYLFGVLKLIHDTHRDEVFIEKVNIIIIRNNQWLFDYNGLIKLARELGVKPYQYTMREEWFKDD